MADDDRLIRELYSESTTRPRTDHPDEATWEAMALGELPAERRQEVLDHVSLCAECAHVYRGLKMLVAEAAIFDAGVPRSASRRPLQWPNRWVYGGLAAAAALVFMLRPVPPSGTSTPGPPLTAPSDDPLRSSASSAPVPVQPTGILEAAPRAFRWQAMTGRSRYRIELFSRTGDLLWASPPVEGTVVDWPSSVPRAAGRYYWQIIALADPSQPLTAPASSPLVSFDVATP